MNGLGQVGIACQGLECGHITGLEQVTDGTQVSGQIGELLPGHRISEITPDPLNSVELGTVGWQPHTADIFRLAGSLQGVSTAAIQEQDRQAVRERRGEHIEGDLAHICVSISKVSRLSDRSRCTFLRL
jgi:hypothetical protein